MRSGPYSPEENSLLESLLDEGATVRTIAARLDRTMCSVEGRMLRAGLAAANRNGEPVTMPVLHQVKVLTAAGIPSRLIATLVGRSKGSIDTIRARYGLKLPALNHHMALKVTDKCRDILQAAACRHKLMPATIARSCLELIVRDRTEAAHAIVAARPVQIAPGELRGIVGLQPSLQARM